jgi:hypothetical protein
MWLNWLRRFVHLSSASRQSSRRCVRPRRRRLCLEPLEDRCVPSILVTTRADEIDGTDGKMSLREAIIAVNAESGSGADIIDFSSSLGEIGTPDPQLPPFPDITHAVIIDGYLYNTGATRNSADIGDNAQINVEIPFPLVLSGAGASGSTITGLALQELDVTNGSNDTITGNFIGVMANGQPFSPAGLGVRLSGTSFTTIGGNTPERNVISGSTVTDVTLFDSPNNRVVGNLIGTDLSGKAAIVDDHSTTGVSIVQDVGLAGGDNQVTSNVVAFHKFSAVEIVRSTGNLIRANSVFSNETVGATSSLPINSFGGGNNNVAAPTLISADPAGVTVAGDVPPNSTLDFYANDAADAGGFYEGKTWLGTFQVPSTVLYAFVVNVPNLPVDSFITATVTDAQNNTSEFSNGILVQPMSGTTHPDDAFEISQLTSLLLAQASFLKILNGKKPPSKAVAQSVLNSELSFERALVILVNTVTNPNDVTFRRDVSAFLQFDAEIEGKVLAIVQMDTKPAIRAAVSPHAKARLRKNLGKIEAEVKSALAQDQALAGELGLA